MVFQVKDLWTLRFELALKLYASVWRPTFEVTLKPIPLQKIDILAAQLYDLQEEVVQLRSEKDESAQLTLETTELVNGCGVLHWKKCNTQDDTTDKFEIEPNGKIRFLQAGRYLIRLTILHQTFRNYQCRCELQRDGVCVKTFMSTTCRHSQTQMPSVTYMVFILMKEGQELTVANASENYVHTPSTMAIVLLR